MKNELITGYITKYALTSGIIKCSGMVDGKVFSINGSGGMRQYFHGERWQRCPVDAILRAEKMRENKIKLLQKQIAKLQAMTFTIPE